MIVIDTNVVSEWMRAPMNPAVGEWLARQTIEDLFLAATSLGELRMGIAILPQGQQKSYLEATLNDILAEFFEGRVLAFDREAAERFGELVSLARTRGHAIALADGQIAAIAAKRGFAVATRDVSPFKSAGLTMINPWIA
jgi:toxin FitB